MAHAIVEWTDNLEADGFAVRPLLELIAEAMRNADGVFPWGGIRVRGLRLTDYVIADDSGQDAFINVTIKMGAGRSSAFKEDFFHRLFEAIKAELKPIYDNRFLAISLYVEEASDDASFKQNNLHSRFRKA